MKPEKDRLYGSELLVAVFAHFENTDFRASDPSAIVDAFFEAKKSGLFDQFFANYLFDETGIDASCVALSRGIRTLQGSGLLGRLNPYLVKYRISPELRADYEESVRAKVTDEDSIRALARSVEESLSRESAHPVLAANYA